MMQQQQLLPPQQQQQQDQQPHSVTELPLAANMTPGFSLPSGEAGSALASSAQTSSGRQLLFSHKGTGVLFVRGSVPQLSVYEGSEGLKVVISTFNLKEFDSSSDLQETENGFVLHLCTDEDKRSTAAVFASSFGLSTLGGPAQECWLEVVVGSAFDSERIEIRNTRIKILIPKKMLKRMQITRVRGD